jgi:uncharacterized damage-inducible protein DinB
MRHVIESIRTEYLRYRQLAENAMAQLDEADLSKPGPNGGSSIATICWHISGNLVSRFTDFLTSDGEKPWRAREEEFQARQVTRAELLETWGRGWDVLFDALAALDDAALGRTVTIRSQPLRVDEALHRSLAHASYHVGQIVYLAKAMRGAEWRYLSIPPGGSTAYNQAPDRERPRSTGSEPAPA